MAAFPRGFLLDIRDARGLEKTGPEPKGMLLSVSVT